jgi:hypothetical protein
MNQKRLEAVIKAAFIDGWSEGWAGHFRETSGLRLKPEPSEALIAWERSETKRKLAEADASPVNIPEDTR